MKYYASLETMAFTADVDSRIMEVFQQFQSLLWLDVSINELIGYYCY